MFAVYDAMHLSIKMFASHENKSKQATKGKRGSQIMCSLVLQTVDPGYIMYILSRSLMFLVFLIHPSHVMGIQ